MCLREIFNASAIPLKTHYIKQLKSPIQISFSISHSCSSVFLSFFFLLRIFAKKKHTRQEKKWILMIWWNIRRNILYFSHRIGGGDALSLLTSAVQIIPHYIPSALFIHRTQCWGKFSFVLHEWRKTRAIIVLFLFQPIRNFAWIIQMASGHWIPS